MIKAIYPGSFDPVTYGHLDVIKRASKVVDELIIGVLVNQEKTAFIYKGRACGTVKADHERISKCEGFNIYRIDN